MAHAEMTVTFAAPMLRALDLVRDPVQLGNNFAFVERAEGRDEASARWELKGAMAALTRTEYLECSASVIVPGERVDWKAAGGSLAMSGSVRLAAAAGDQTAAYLTIDVEAKGLMAPILAPMIGMQVESQLQALAINLQRRLAERSDAGSQTRVA
ncbi:MAG: SRPBCC family protein [Actinobacteria bacterium]|nr:SRPBCC family protein [Actinomycetota bacterium]